MRINPIDALKANIAQLPKPDSSVQREDFGEMLMDAMKEVNQAQNDSRSAQNAFMTGQPGVEVHDLMIAMEKANVSLQLTMQIRNKILEAYQEITRMQI